MVTQADRPETSTPPSPSTAGASGEPLAHHPRLLGEDQRPPLPTAEAKGGKLPAVTGQEGERIRWVVIRMTKPPDYTTHHQHPRRGPHQGPCEDHLMLWLSLVALANGYD